MKPSEALELNRSAIRAIVEKHNAVNARVFGSSARKEDSDDSDLDILVDPTPDMTMLDLGAIRHDLINTLGVDVDVLTPNALPDRFKDSVLAEAVPV